MTKRTTNHADLLRRSEKFLKWRPNSRASSRTYLLEDKTFKPEELAALWGVSVETIRSVFRREPGVVRTGKTDSRYRHGYMTLRISEESAERVHQKLSA